MNKRVLKKAFFATIPVMTGYPFRRESITE